MALVLPSNFSALQSSVGFPGLDGAMVSMCSPEGTWSFLSVLCLALYGLGCLTWQVISLLALLVDKIANLVTVVQVLLWPWFSSSSAASGSGPDPGPGPGQATPTPANSFYFDGLWACDSIRRSHVFHIKEDCSEFKSMTKRWPLRVCPICKP